MTFTVERIRRRSKKCMRPEQELQRQLGIALKTMLTPGTFHFVMSESASDRADLPRQVFIYNGRAFYLDLKPPNAILTSSQRAVHVALRDAGARVEVARSLPEALARLREFGIPLRNFSLQSVFRSAA